MCKDSVHRCPPLVTRRIDCANWIMEPIASTYRGYLISSGAPLLIQSHPPVQCSVALLIFTNVFVTVIDFFFSFRVAFHKENSLHTKPEFHFLSALYEPAALCSICRAAAELFFLGGWGRVGVQPCGTSLQNAVPACPRRAAGLMTNTWILHMDR